MNTSLHDLPTELTSERLLLRRYQPGDSAVYHRMLRENLEDLYEFLPSFLIDVGEEDVKAWLERQSAEWEVPRIEIGYFLAREFVGQGYATEAAKAAIRYAFEQMKVLRIDLRCAADNTGSIEVADRCGFTREGCFRQHHRKKDGRLVDTLWYGLLLSEWQDMHDHD